MILVKVEALNIYGFVYAARDLGAIRGAGLSLLGMPQELEKWLSETYPDVKRITSGASKATLMLGDERADAGKIQAEIKGWLAKQYP